MLPLGAGAFGEVHLAWDQLDGRWVALKRFTGQDELGLLRMVIESRIRVSHPHLVRTVAFHLVDDRAWLVTELARGGSLRTVMTRTGVLPWGWVAEAVDQVLAALTTLHATGVIHRDLKPANLLLRSTGATAPHLLVGDFGIATWRTVSMTGIGAAIGTPGYLAPEYLDGKQPSPTTDVFAVGVLAAELLTGQRLIHYSNASPTMPSSWGDVLPVPPETPRGLAAVLQRMADPDPRRRYRDCTEAREALLTAVPPATRGDLTTVPVPDLLAALPPGWTVEGPEQPTPMSASEPNLVALPIDGGPTELVLEPGPAFEPDASATSLTEPPTQASGSATPPITPPTGSPTHPPAGSAAPPTARPGASPLTPPSGSAAPTAAQRKAETRRRWRRKAKRAFLLLILIIFASGAGTLWWAANHRAIPGRPSAAGSATGGPEGTSRWEPTIVAGCARVELDSTRPGANGTERCQRTPDLDPPQHWVEAPPTGFPISNAGGPFPHESCTTDGDRDYSPVGDHVECDNGAWRVIA